MQIKSTGTFSKSSYSSETNQKSKEVMRKIPQRPQAAALEDQKDEN